MSIILWALSMADQTSIESSEGSRPHRGPYWIAWMGAATIALALVVVLWPAAERPSGSLTRESHLPFGAAEQAYAPNVQIDGLALSRAENFLNQEVTTLAGRLTNTGKLPLSNVEVTVEFYDQFGQVVLRESRAAFAPKSSQLAPGQGRGFEVSFEHIPSSWNIQQPRVSVSGILFPSKKE